MSTETVKKTKTKQAFMTNHAQTSDLCGLNGFGFYILWLQSSDTNLNDAKRWLVHARHDSGGVHSIKGKRAEGMKTD